MKHTQDSGLEAGLSAPDDGKTRTASSSDAGTTSSFLNALADEVEAAEGPSRELDARIALLLRADEPMIIGAMPGRFPQDPIWGTIADLHEINLRDLAEYITAAPYTASLDAALTLANGLSEQAIWVIWNDALTRCSKFDHDIRKDVARYWTAAALRARAVQP